jgi:hypothetical protein
LIEQRLIEQRRWLAYMLLAALSAVCFAATLKISHAKLSLDSMDYAQCARQVARGEGFTSKYLVAGLTDDATVDGNLGGTWRNTIRTPLPVYTMAVAFRLFGVSDDSLTYASALFYVLTSVLLLRAFEPLFGFRIAFISALAFIVSNCGLLYARAGMSESAAMFFLVLVFALLQGKPGPARCLVVGVVFGISALNRPIALGWGVAAAFYLWQQRERAARRIGALFAGMAAIVAASKLIGLPSSHVIFAVNLALKVGDPADAYRSPL